MKIRAQHILVQHSHEVEDLQKKLREGVDFSQLAEKYSQCPSSHQGGDLGYFTPGRMVEAFDEAAFSLEPGQISEPVRTRFGYHLIRRVE